MNDVKPLLATATAMASAITTWMPHIESALRIGVSIVGILASIYAIRYYRSKTK
jgi:hypothetical protein